VYLKNQDAIKNQDALAVLPSCLVPTFMCVRHEYCGVAGRCGIGRSASCFGSCLVKTCLACLASSVRALSSWSSRRLSRESSPDAKKLEHMMQMKLSTAWPPAARKPQIGRCCFMIRPGIPLGWAAICAVQDRLKLISLHQ